MAGSRWAGTVMGRKLLNAALFQVAWFAAVLGAAKGMPWLGPLVMVPVLGIHLATAENRSGEIKLLLAAGILGFLLDTVLVAFGIFLPVPSVLPRPFSPPWMICLWLNFAATLNVSMGWLRGRYLLAVIFGAIGGPLAYYGGAKMGATETLPTMHGLLVLIVVWGLMTPLLIWLANLFTSEKKLS